MSQSRVTDEQLASMVDMLPTASSFRQISRAMGLRLDVVRREMRPILAIMKLQGQHPKCRCGRDAFHPYGCGNSVATIMARGDLPGQTAFGTAVTLAKREAIVAEIMTGDTFADIEERLGRGRKSVRKFLKYLTPEQRAERKRLEQRRKEPRSDAK